MFRSHFVKCKCHRPPPCACKFRLHTRACRNIVGVQRQASLVTSKIGPVKITHCDQRKRHVGISNILNQTNYSNELDAKRTSEYSVNSFQHYLQDLGSIPGGAGPCSSSDPAVSSSIFVEEEGKKLISDDIFTKWSELEANERENGKERRKGKLDIWKLGGVSKLAYHQSFRWPLCLLPGGWENVKKIEVTNFKTYTHRSQLAVYGDTESHRKLIRGEKKLIEDWFGAFSKTCICHRLISFLSFFISMFSVHFPSIKTEKFPHSHKNSHMRNDRGSYHKFIIRFQA